MLEALAADFTSPLEATPLIVAVMRMIFALLLGGAIGWEREAHAKSAGLRTHMMIAMAACLFTLLTFELVEAREEESAVLRMDPIRLIEAVTAGVAFLAAGSIITAGDKVRGLTTGAGMWLAGAIGVACGLGHLPLATLTALIALLVLAFLRWLLPAGRNARD